MNRPETIQLFALISALYPREETFRNADSQTISCWAEMLSDLAFPEVKAALKMHSAKSCFPPAISDIRSAVADLNPDEGITPDEAWSLVMAAIRRSTLFSVREFNKLPEICQKLVGSPMQLKEWATSETFNAGVEKSLFTKSYAAKRKQATEYKKLPESVRMLIAASAPRELKA